MRSRTLATAVVVLALAATTACEPAPPPPTFQVDSFLSGADADPGDGACRTASGTCTVQAAVQEADALGTGVVLVPGSGNTHYGGFDVTITGHVTVRAYWSGSHDRATINSSVLTVAAGAGLILDSIDLDGTVVVDGGFVASSVGIRSIDVGTTGTAIVTNAVLVPSDDAALVNEGRAFLQYSTVALWSGASGLVTFGNGETTIAATAVLGFVDVPSTTCYGNAPVSLGYNAVTDADCALTGPGDRQDAAVLTEFEFLPAPGSVLVDAVPVGTLGCGTSVTTDMRGPFGPRPVDGNGDGTSACDIGAYEANHLSE